MLDASAKQPQSILVVDDEAALRNVVSRTLSGAGYSVEEACDVLSASDSLNGHEFSAILTDLYMPGLPGVAMIEEVARRGQTTPVILMSSSIGDLDPCDQCIDRLAGLLAKPFSVATLRDLLGRILQGSR